MEKKLNFKKLLATASAFAVITGASNSAMGAVKTTGGNEALNAPGTWAPAGVPANNDSIRIDANGRTLDADAVGRIIAAYDNAGFNPGDIKVTNSFSLGSVGGAGNAVNVVFDGVGQTLTLTGTAGGAIAANDYTGLGNIDFANKNTATLTINNAAGVETVLAGNAANADANSILNVQTNLTVNQTFAPIGQVNITDGKTLHITAGNNDVAPAGGANWKFLGNDSRLKFTVDTVAAKTIIFAAAFDPVGGAADDKGILEVINIGIANVLTLDGGGANIGNANDHRLKEFITAGTGEIKITNGSIFAKKISINGTGQVEFTDALDSGANSTLTFGDDGDVLFSDNATVATIDFNGKNAKVNVAAGKAITGDVTTTVNNTGNLVFAAAGGVTGTIGAEDLALNTVEVTGAGAVNLDGKTHYAETFLFKNAAAKLVIADNGSLHGNADANAGGDGVIEFTQNGKIVGTIGTKNNLLSVIANGAGTVKIGAGNHKVTTFKAANAGSIFDFADGANVDGAIDNIGNAAANTKLNFAGNSIVTGDIGTNNAFAQVNIGGGTVAIGGDLTATNVIFADSEDSILQIQGNAAHAITGKISENDNKGTIKIATNVGANNVTFASEIGDDADAGKKLKRLEIENGFTGEVQLDADTHITDVQIGGAAKIRLAANDYKFGGITSTNGGGNGTLLVNADGATLKGRAAPADAVINLGTSENGLSTLQFAANHTLNIGDGVNIHVNTLDNGGGNTFGKLEFKGTSVFETAALANAGDKFSTITLDNKANVTILSPNTVVNGLTKLGDNSTLAIAGNFDTNGGLQGANDAVGTTLKFINANKATIAGAVGGANASLASIEFAGGDVEFANAVTHAAGNKFVFSGDTASTVKFNAATNVGDNIFTNESATTNTVVLANAGGTTFTKDLATSVDNQLNFQLDNGVNAEITGGNATGTNFTTGTDKQGILKLNKPAGDLVINSAGEFNKSLAKVDFTKSATITNNTYAEAVQVAVGETATLGGTIESPDFKLLGADSKAVFSDVARVNSVIATGIANEGLVEFTGGATISRNLGVDAANALKTVTFADNAEKIATIASQGDVVHFYATEIAMRKGVVKLESDAVLHGATTATATTLDLRDKTLVANGNLTFNGATKIEFSTTNAGNTLEGGQITIAAGGNLVFANGTTLAITADDKGNARPTSGASHDFTLINSDVVAAKLDTNNVKVEKTNRFTSWTHTVSEDGLILTQIDNAAGELKKILGAKADAANIANADALAKAEQGTQGYKVVALASTLSDEKVGELFDRLVPLTTVADSIENTTTGVGDSLGARAMSLAGDQGHPVSRVVSSEGVSGLSAGDDHAKFGAWFSPFYNNTTQKARKGAAGYKGESYGASFGFDTRTNEDTIIGAAFTAANSELKHKNFKSGDKTKVNSLLFSIYGMHQITDTWFALGSATVGTNEVKNNERKVSGTTSHEIASAKYSSMSFSGEVMFGYNHVTEQATITPMGGLRYTRVNDGGYKETGTADQNLDVSTKASNKFEVILGARASGGTFDLNGLSVTPEVHAFINHDMINKNSKQSIKLDSTTLTGKSSKPVRTTYNLGLGANAEFGAMEYGASYDAQLANKRVGHQGTLRLRVNF